MLLKKLTKFKTKIKAKKEKKIDCKKNRSSDSSRIYTDIFRLNVHVTFCFKGYLCSCLLAIRGIVFCDTTEKNC